jgi:hypothetical protein
MCFISSASWGLWPSHACSTRMWSNSDRSCEFPRISHDACSKRSRVTSVSQGAGRGDGPGQFAAGEPQ